MRPHFWVSKKALSHIPGCDEATFMDEHHRARRNESTVTRTRHTGPEILIIQNEAVDTTDPRVPTTPDPGATRTMATATAGSGRTGGDPTTRTTHLGGLLARILDNKLDPTTKLKIPNGEPGSVEDLVRPLSTITADDKGLYACFYGRVARLFKNEATESTFLQMTPTRSGPLSKLASVMIRADQAPGLQEHLKITIDTMANHDIIVIGTVRVPRSGNCYIELDSPTSIACLKPRRHRHLSS